MKPIDFKQKNQDLKKPERMSDEECSPLPVFTDGKQCISCWKASPWERIKVLFRGKIWVSILSGDTQPPIWIDIAYPFIENK